MTTYQKIPFDLPFLAKKEKGINLAKLPVGTKLNISTEKNATYELTILNTESPIAVRVVYDGSEFNGHYLGCIATPFSSAIRLGWLHHEMCMEIYFKHDGTMKRTISDYVKSAAIVGKNFEYKLEWNNVAPDKNKSNN